MSKDLFDKYTVCLRLFSRIASGLDFLEEYITRNKKTDSAHLRSLYILLSFHFELLLKAFVILKFDFKTPEEANDKLQSIGHNIKKLEKAIGSDELREIGILSISIKDKEFLISTSKGEIKIKDFTDIRYDFLPVNGYVKMRVVPKNEIQMIKESVQLTNEVLMKLKEKMDFLRAMPSTF